MIEQLHFTCCFCNQRIQDTDVDPCNINIMANYGKEVDYQPTQDFFCHFACLKNGLHSYYKEYFLETTFSVQRDEYEVN